MTLGSANTNIFDNLSPLFKGNGWIYIVLGLLLALIYLFISALYTIRLRTVKMTYDAMLKNIFKFTRIETDDFGGGILNFPVNPLIIYLQYTILCGEILIVYNMCFNIF